VLALLLLAVALQVKSSATPTQARIDQTLIHSPLGRCQQSEERHAPHTIRVATWNIHSARSAPLTAIAGEIRATAADIIALQEVDRDTRRTGSVNQPEALAAALGVHYAFAASIQVRSGDYGLAVLSRWPLVDVVRHRVNPTDRGEPRIVLEVVVCADGRRLRIFNHHADTSPDARRVNLAELKQIVGTTVGAPTIVLGDFNSTPDGRGIQSLVDMGIIDTGATRNTPTKDAGRIDYLLVDRSLAAAVRRSRVWKSGNSDHDALVVELEW
jgi:endonuclease/exonuclease/phosphatase family metal-dependent hydrolase